MKHRSEAINCRLWRCASINTKAIYRNKYTAAVGFDFAQPTERSRVERSCKRLAQKSKLANTGIFFLGNHLSKFQENINNERWRNRKSVADRYI